MNWEAVTALSSAFTGLIIAITAVAALREVRIGGEHAQATREQIEHLRKATQFEGALAVFAELDTPTQVDARAFVLFELADRMKDEQFRREVSRAGAADERVHKELHVLRCFERVGFYATNGLVDAEVVYLVASGRAITTWHALEDVVEIHRRTAGSLWMNFERLCTECYAWSRGHNIDVDKFLESKPD
jgi:hypothetical protein